MKKLIKKYSIVILFIILNILGHYLKIDLSKRTIDNFMSFFVTMIKFVPPVFILIGLFEAWINRALIEKHLGYDSSFKAYFWAILLASTTIGGLYVAFPIAHSLHKKGAALRIIFSYVGSAAIVRIPMTLFEASFLGIKFSLIRIGISLPLVILSSILLERIIIKYNLKLGSKI